CRVTHRLLRSHEVGTEHVRDLKQARTRLLNRVECHLGPGNAVSLAGDLGQYRVVDQPVQVVGLHDHCGPKLAPGAIAVGPINQDDVATGHGRFRYCSYSSSAGSSHPALRVTPSMAARSFSYCSRGTRTYSCPVSGSVH